MKRDEILSILVAHRNELREQFGIKSLALFGSVARNEAVETSDVDLLVEFDRPVGLFEFARVRRYLSSLFGCEVDLVTLAALRQEMREHILQEAIRAPYTRGNPHTTP